MFITRKLFNSYIFSFYVFYYIKNVLSNPVDSSSQESSIESWHGPWFPYPPGQTVDDNPTVEYREKSDTALHDVHHGVLMGIPSELCDTGKVNLTRDWDNSPINYTCFEDKHLYLPSYDVHPTLHIDHIPTHYRAMHKCMNESIKYDDVVPTFGIHRPLWPKWGEYIFLPKQRWVHGLEHGAIVMLYHPCAAKAEVKLLKNLVNGCLYRHLITPYNLLTPDLPLALVAWGSRLEMSKVDPFVVVEFIRKFALRGPEQLSKLGQYDYGLLSPAKVVSDESDYKLCPNF